MDVRLTKKVIKFIAIQSGIDKISKFMVNIIYILKVSSSALDRALENTLNPIEKNQLK